jgi:hypothetical protein
MADQSLNRSDQGSLGGPAPVRTRPSPRSPKALQYQFNRTEPHTCCSFDSNACLQVVTARLRVVIEATASVRCSDDGKSEEFTARTRQLCLCRMHLICCRKFPGCPTHFRTMLSARTQVYSVDVVSEATGARWISFRRFREFDVLCFLPRPFLARFWNR